MPKIAVEIFGFHVQQTVEKVLKALLCVFGVKFPKIHDLDELAAMLKDANQPLPEPFVPLLAYTDFAVTFRYDAFPEFEANINREQTIVTTGQLIAYVEKLLEENSIC